jgi:hypothetical protein
MFKTPGDMKSLPSKYSIYKIYSITGESTMKFLYEYLVS